MNHTFSLDPIIRKHSGPQPAPAGEEVLVTIDTTTNKAVKKTLAVRVRRNLQGNFQDYLVANDLNPTRTAGGKLAPYYIRDAKNERTLALEISVGVCCPVAQEARVAEALHAEQTPTRVFTDLLERWVREFIPQGDEGRFIDTYDAAHHQLENHLAARAAAHTGLRLLWVKVALSGEVPDEIVVGPIEIGVRLQDYKGEQKLRAEAGLSLDAQHYVRAFVYQEKRASPEELFKSQLKSYFLQHVTFEQFSRELQQPNFRQRLQQALSAALRQVGRHVSFINFPTGEDDKVAPPPEFVAVNYDYNHRMPGRAQPVVIQNTVQLYCVNSVAFLASPVTDLEAWVKSTLNVILKRYLIGKTYVDLLLRFAPLEQSIKRELSARAALIGYKVDHLVSIPNLKEVELSNPFLLETEGTFKTKLDDFEVELKFSLKLRIRNLQSLEKYLNPGTDVKEAIKEAALSEARQCLRHVHPERFYLHFNQPDEKAANNPSEDERLAVKDLLSKRIAESLRAEFDAEIFDLTARVGRTDLTDRYKQLCHVIREFRVSLESPDPQGTEALTLTGSFEVDGVYPDSNGWQRFSALRLDLDGLQTQLENHLKAELKTYRQLGFMFQNRLGRLQVFDLVQEYASAYMRREFGLIVHLTNLDRNTTEVEERQRQRLAELENTKLASAVEQDKLLVSNLSELRRRRVNLMSMFPVDQAALREIEENIRLLEAELEAVASARFGQHQLAAAFEAQQPDDLPPLGEARQAANRYDLESGSEPKGRLAG
ncbi:MAG TPA: hypothetical protein VF546_03105 [Pyrinomonadaceae bacterium]|jgi:hypothetical protein